MSSTFKHAFPLEALGSDIARNNYNYESIFNGLMEWNSSTRDTVTVRLTKSTYPYFHDYTFPTKYATTSQIGSEYVNPVAAKAYAYNGRYDLSAAAETVSSDKITLRVTINNNGNTYWKPFIEAIVYDENTESTDYIKASLVRTHDTVDDNKIYIVNEQTSPASTLDELISLGYAVPYIRDYTGDMVVYQYNGIVYDGNLYISNASDGFHMNNVPPSNYDDGTFMNVGKVWKASGTYNKGDYVVAEDSDGNYHTFVNLLEDGLNTSNPCDYLGTWTAYNSSYTYDENADSDKAWAEVVFLPIFTSGVLKSTSVVRFDVPTDMKGIVLRNDSDDTYASPETSITMSGNLSYHASESIYDRRVGVFDTSNYLMYPENKNNIWTGGSATFDSSISGNKRQNYSASMIFDHGVENISTINYINYDGPDLDQGLCIYLPIESQVGDSVSVPEDGYTFEFFFRIWPTTSYNNAVTSDAIINKAQIYVYSVPTAEDAKKDNCGNPIAKFSMARLTNFYVYDENIAIANRPVMYRATFVYSESKGVWEIFDYYQLPDHVFVGPIGFVDPTNVGATADEDSKFTGLETAGFPMFSDPFDN